MTPRLILVVAAAMIVFATQTALADASVDRVPEPGSMVLLATGIGALLFATRRRKRD
ncbi:MAG: PEP-CTERM sorting domain-containing protein [Alphaproteobacteria bacterium]